MAFLEQKGTLAKLLASENLIINYDPRASTASFNTATRILTMPLLQTESEHVFNLMMAHEASHALHTPVDWVDRIDDDIPFDIVNICEDVRIERIIQSAFPGLRRDFSRGYNELHEKDFFEISEKDVNKLSFVDRLNLHFKGGARLMIQFAPDEKPFITRLDQAETFEDVLIIANDITTFVKAQKQEQEKQETEEYQEDDNGEKVQEHTENKVDSADGADDDIENPETLDGPDETKSKTQEALDKNLQSLQDQQQNRVEYVKAPDAELSAMPIEFLREDFQSVRDSIVASGGAWRLEKMREEYDMFMASIKRDVNFMVQQFEMKKSADAYARSTVHRTGQLDMHNLHNYKLTDDLFLRQTVTPEGKNHGMVMLLDWSGSMQDRCLATVKQLLVLTQFCRKINIPFDVYTFTCSSYGAPSDACSDANLDGQIVIRGINLTHVLSSSVKKRDLDEDMYHLFAQGSYHSVSTAFSFNSSYLSMGGTPLNNILFMVPEMVKKMKEQTRAQKISFVCLTDGESTPLFKYERAMTWAGKEEWVPRMTAYHKHLFLRDGCRVYQLDQGMEQTGSIVKYLMDKLPDVTFTHIYLGGPASCSRYVKEITNYRQEMNDQEFRRKGSTVVATKDWPLVALINPNTFGTPTDEIAVMPGATRGKIRAALKKMLKTKQSSKIVLSQLVNQFS